MGIRKRLATMGKVVSRTIRKGQGMKPESACRLINESMMYRPGWTFEATEHKERFENAIRVRIEFDTLDTSAVTDAGYESSFRLHVTFTLMVGKMDDVGLYRAVLGVILRVEEHEAREFLRIRPTHWAPFHPHQDDGIERWHQTPNVPDYFVTDIQYGI